jgi:hypothetical protein
VLVILIAITNPLTRQGLNLHPLGPVASTLTTTPPRRLSSEVTGLSSKRLCLSLGEPTFKNLSEGTEWKRRQLCLILREPTFKDLSEGIM